MMASAAAEGVLEHLLFHKAMIDEDTGSEKIDHYLSVLREARPDICPQDPLDRSIETVFELVLSANMDPWDIDLVQFTKLYTEKVKGEEVNFVLAGKLMLMAWSILRLQSERVLTNSETRPDFYFNDVDFDSLDLFQPDIPRVVLCLPEDIELDEVVRHHGTRPVTLVELLDAFQEAQLEEEQNALRERAREAAKLKLAGAFDTKAHNDDMERDVEDVWQRICKCGSGAITIEDIWYGGKEDLVTVFMALLFLVRAGKISAWQDDVPYGKIMLEVKMAWDIGTLEDVPNAPTPRAVQASKEAVM